MLMWLGQNLTLTPLVYTETVLTTTISNISIADCVFFCHLSTSFKLENIFKPAGQLLGYRISFNPKQHKYIKTHFDWFEVTPTMPSFLTQQPNANPRLPFPILFSSLVIHQTSTLFSEAMNQWGCRNVARYFQGEKPKLSVFGWITFTSQRLHNGTFKSFVHTTLSNPSGGEWSPSYLPLEWCLGKFEGPKADVGLGKAVA